MNSIAAKGDHTGRCAGILGIGVAVITGLFTIPKHPITANRHGTGTQTRIGINQIAIIALLTLLHRTIAAAGRLASIARIGRIVVAIIAALAWPDHAVAAARL